MYVMTFANRIFILVVLLATATSLTAAFTNKVVETRNKLKSNTFLLMSTRCEGKDTVARRDVFAIGLNLFVVGGALLVLSNEEVLASGGATAGKYT